MSNAKWMMMGVLLVCVLGSVGAYTNLAGNVISGAPIQIDHRTVTLSNAQEVVVYPLSIFPDSEQRRLASDAGQPRIPPTVRRAVAGLEKSISRSRKRAEMGLCTEEESRAFCEKTEKALQTYLDRQVKAGVITSAERQILVREN